MAEFVGRAEELSTLHSWAHEAAVSKVGRFVLVTGEAGAGKTELCAEFTRTLAVPGAAKAWSRCWVGGGGPPLWPWPDLLSELASQRGKAANIQYGNRDQFGLFREITDQLRALCAEGPLIALIDDLHAVNGDAFLFTRFFARSLHRFPLLLVATWRVEGSDQENRLRSLSRDATSIDLGPFGVDEVSAYVAASRRDGQMRVPELLAASGGNPMYLAELVHHSQAGASLAQALARRVECLPEAQREVLGAAALLGDAATVEETAQIIERPVGEVEQAVASLASGATVVDGRIRFSHDLLKEAFLAGLSVPQRQHLHASAMREIGGSDPKDAVRRAHHAVQAATDDETRLTAAAACAEAADALRRTLAFEEAAIWAGKAADLAPAHAEFQLVHADAVLACGRLSEAHDIFDRAVAPAQRASDPTLLARAALGLGGVWVEEQRDEISRRRMLGLCKAALTSLEADHRLAARLRVRLAAEQSYAGAGVEDVCLAVDDLRRLGDAAALAEALSLYHHALLLPTHAEARLAVAEELLDVAAQVDGSIYVLFGLCWRTVDLYLLGAPGADRAFIDLRERTTALGSRAIGYIVAVLDVMRAFRRGELDQAETGAGDALALGTAVGDADAFGYYGAHLLAIRWVQGRLDETIDLIRSVIDSATLRRHDVVYPAALAYGLAMSGDHARARVALDDALADGLDAIHNFSTWTATLTIVVETAAELGDGKLALKLAESFAPHAHLPVMPSLAVVCMGPGERVMGVAHAAADRLDDAVDWFAAALEANRALGNRPVDALIRAQFAAVLRRRGSDEDLVDAARLYAEAVEQGRELGLTGRVPAWERDAASQGVIKPIPRAVRGVLTRRSSDWHIEIDGRAAVIDHVVGLRYIAELLARPDTDLTTEELSKVVTGGVPDSYRGEATLDEQARREYQNRIGELDRELDSADLTGDEGRARRAAEERAQILDTLRRETGLGGRPRRTPNPADRARGRVSRAIQRAIGKLTKLDPVLGRALETSIRTGNACRYVSDPGRPIVWSISR